MSEKTASTELLGWDDPFRENTQTDGSAGRMHYWIWRKPLRVIATIPWNLDQSPGPRSMPFQVPANEQLERQSTSACLMPIMK